MATLDERPTNAPKQSGFLRAYQQTYPAIIHHPATWLLTILWLLATIYLLAVGKATPLNFFATGISLLFALLALSLTQGAPPAPWETPVSSPGHSKLWLQCILTILGIFLLALLTLLTTLQTPIPWLVSFYTIFRTNVLFRLGLALIAEIIIPLALVFLLGTRWREIGFQKGYHSGRVTAILSAPFIIYFLFALTVRKIALPLLLVRIVLNFLLAGIPEEIAWRGVIMTRLFRLLGTGWGIALSSLIFAILHIGTNIFLNGSTPLIAFAQTIMGQMPAGVCFAIIFQRTRSLLPVIIPHALTDTLSSIL